MIKMKRLPASNPFSMTMMNFAEVPLETYRWAEERLSDSMSRLTDAGRGFLDGAIATYDYLRKGDLVSASRRLRRAVKNITHPNNIVRYQSIAEIQAATPLMQRYLMANPPIRGMYHRQQCDGYSDSYVDLEPGLIGMDHYEYRRVVNGIAIEDPLNPGTIYIPEIFESLLEEDRELDTEEKFDILDGWDIAAMAARLGVDPTDVHNGELASPLED